MACLFSGGKDSIYAIYIAQQYGWEVEYLVSILSENPNSYMFHTQNIEYNHILAKALDIEYIENKTKGLKENELIDLEKILRTLDVDGVISGAIASEYQKIRIDRICEKIGIKSFAPLWRKNQKQLLYDMIDAGFEILIVGVFAYGLNQEWLGKIIDEDRINGLILLNKKYGINIAGEGGEYETFVLNCPIFNKGFEVNDSKVKWNRDSGIFNILNLKFEK